MLDRIPALCHLRACCVPIRITADCHEVFEIVGLAPHASAPADLLLEPVRSTPDRRSEYEVFINRITLAKA